MLKETTLVVTIVAVAALAIGLVLPEWARSHLLIGITRGIAIVSLVLLLRTGLISFGHALYLAVGGYTVVFLNHMAGITDFFITLACVALICAVLGYGIGFLVRHHKEIFFAMVNLAISMILYGALVKTAWLGSSDGFSVEFPTFAGAEFASSQTARTVLFALVIALAWGLALSILYYRSTVFGRLAEAVRDNDIRVDYLGYPAKRIVHTNLVISATLTGMAGAIIAMSVGQVDPNSMAAWTASGELVFVTVMAGTGGVLTAFGASVFFEFLRTFALEFAPDSWNLLVGLTLLAIIVFLPDGFSSLRIKTRRVPVHGGTEQ